MSLDTRNETPGKQLKAEDLTSLVKIAIRHEDPQITLSQITQTLGSGTIPDELDPLTVIPLLLPCSRGGVAELLHVLGKHCNAKELLIATQEASETLVNLVATHDETDYSEDEELDALSPPRQVIRLIQLYAEILPRLPKRNKELSEILQPPLKEIQRMISLFFGISDGQSDRELILVASILLQSLRVWISQPSQDTPAARVILRDVMESALYSSAKSVSANVVQDAFRKQFPRFAMPSPTTGTSEEGEDVVQNALAALSQLGFTATDFQARPSIPSLILLAHSGSTVLDVSGLVSFLPTFVTSIQSNNAVDETLAVLLSSFGGLRTQMPTPELPVTLIIPLVHVLAPLSSSHPDPTTRHVTFRLLSLVLSLTPSPARLRLLKDLLSESEGSPPQMRIAAVGLVKEAVLEALSIPLSSAETRSNVFTSPLFIQEVGSTIFSIQPPNLLLDPNLTLEEFLEQPEPVRLVEALGLLYVLVHRDVDNRTGVRDPVLLKGIRKNVLIPLRDRIASWKEGGGAFDDGNHENMQADILQMWVNRVLSTIDV